MGTHGARRERRASGAQPPRKGARARWLGQRRDGRRGLAGERLRRGPGRGGGRRGERVRRGSRGKNWKDRESGQWRGRGAGRQGRRAPARPVNGGSRVEAEAGPTGRTGAAHRGSGRARGGGRAGQGVPGPEAPQVRGSMPGTAAPEVAGAGDRGGGGHQAAQAPLTRKSSGPGGGLGLATVRPAPKLPRRWGETCRQGPRGPRRGTSQGRRLPVRGGDARGRHPHGGMG